MAQSHGAARNVPWIIAGLLVALLALAGPLRAEEARWQVLSQGDPMFRAERPGAGISLRDRFAMLQYLPVLGGWLATVILRRPEEMGGVASTLVDIDGSTASLTLDADNIETRIDPATGAALVSFAIKPADVARFRAASVWRVSLGTVEARFPLLGSHAALGAVLAVIGQSPGGERAGHELPGSARIAPPLRPHRDIAVGVVVAASNCLHGPATDCAAD